MSIIAAALESRTLRALMSLFNFFANAGNFGTITSNTGAAGAMIGSGARAQQTHLRPKQKRFGGKY